jgi:hypothetical protein
MPTLRTCVDRVIPSQFAKEARAAREAERFSAEELAMPRSNLWKNGRVLRVRFLDGDPAVHAKVAAVAKEWMKYSNVAFEFGNDPDAEIRISFLQEGYWSALGTDALVTSYFPKNEPTMNFGGFTADTPDEEYQRVVLHEFGHALGCIHEHQNPAGGIQWNKDVVYRDLGGEPNNWDKATVDSNMFEAYAEDQTNFTDFDRDSIMLYSFPASWTLNGVSFPTNRRLSDTDKKFIAAQYPKKG